MVGNISYGHDFIKKNKDIPVSDRDIVVLALVEYATPILNTVNQRNYSSRYWLILLALHFKHCVRIKTFIEEKELLEIKPMRIPILGRSKIGYKDYLLSYGLEVFGTLDWFLKKRDRDNENVIQEHDDLIIGHRSNAMLKFIGGSTLKAMHFPGTFYLRGDRKKRKELKDLIYDIKDSFIRNSLYSIPKIFLEYYQLIDNSIRLIDPQGKKFHYEHYSEYYFDFLIAKYAEFGAELHEYQGGGHVGEIVGTPSQIVYRRCNFFHTFGWMKNIKDIPDKPFRLIDFKSKLIRLAKDTYNSEEKSILFVYPTFTEKTIGICQEMTNYLNLGHLNNKYERVIVRPRPMSRRLALFLRGKTNKWNSNIELDKGRNHIVYTIAQVNLVVVIGLPSTTFLECLYVGKPVIALNTNTRPSDLFAEFLPGLVKSGIVFQSIADLIAAINAIVDVDRWWTQVYTQKDVREFCKQFVGLNE